MTRVQPPLPECNALHTVPTKCFKLDIAPSLTCRWKEYSTSINSLDTISDSVSYALFGSKKVARRQADLFTRMATLEARGSKRGFVFFLPFMFFAFGFVLGEFYS